MDTHMRRNEKGEQLLIYIEQQFERYERGITFSSHDHATRCQIAQSYTLWLSFFPFAPFEASLVSAAQSTFPSHSNQERRWLS